LPTGVVVQDGTASPRDQASDDLSDVLSEFARTMLTDFPIQGILDRLVSRVVDIMPVTGAGVTLIAADLNPRYVTASNESALRFEKLQSELGEGPCLVAYQTGAAVELPDLRLGKARFPRFSSRALAGGLAAVFTFPMHHGDVRLGALDLYRATPGALSPDSMVAAQTLADVAAAYLINAQGRADLQVSSDRAREASLHDSLTGLPNRALMMDRLEHAFRHRVRASTVSAVFFLDLDGFKAVNDTYGHQIGDELLVQVARRLTAVMRPGDSVGRLGGDEFVVLCEDLDEPAQAEMISRRFDAALELPFPLSAGSVHMGASIGVALTGDGDDSAEQLLHAADRAMYRAKRQRDGGDLVALDRLLPGDHQADLEHALAGAAQRGELDLAYQPIVAAADGRVTGAEALLRWTHPTRGSVAPAVLIPLAEQSGEIIPIGQWALERAWSDRSRWQSQHAKELSVSVNVSAHQLMAAGFADTVAAVLESAPTDPGLLTLEVTESIFVRDGDRARLVLNDLKSMGVRLALDDFGTGYSSLGYLRRLPLDIVKVDREFVAHLGSEGTNHTIVSAVIQLAHGLGLTVVSEGVETVDQHRELTALGCDACQGFYFARPMPASNIDTLMEGQDEASPWILPR
jgi:diguanylate cyclase (GGDEF)-like protein